MASPASRFRRWAAVVAAGAAVAAVVVAADRLVRLAPMPAPLEEAVPAAVATSTEAPAAVAPPSNDVRLEYVLADGSLPTQERAAWATLYTRWGLEYPVDHRVSPCEFGRPAGFRCFTGTTTWGRLRRLDLPAILELKMPDGEAHFATLVALDDRTATLDFGTREVSVALSEIDRHWNGAFALLWYAPLRSAVLRPGRRSRDVQWLRQQLSALEGLPPLTVAAPDVYDAELLGKVKAFQTSRLLVADGIAGEETLVHLSAAARSAGTPGLRRP